MITVAEALRRGYRIDRYGRGTKRRWILRLHPRGRPHTSDRSLAVVLQRLIAHAQSHPQS